MRALGGTLIFIRKRWERHPFRGGVWAARMWRIHIQKLVHTAGCICPDCIASSQPGIRLEGKWSSWESMPVTGKTQGLNKPLTPQGTVGDTEPRSSQQAEAAPGGTLSHRRWGHRRKGSWDKTENRSWKEQCDSPFPLVCLLPGTPTGQALPEVEPLLDMQSASAFCPELQGTGEGLGRYPDKGAGTTRAVAWDLSCSYLPCGAQCREEQEERKATLTLLLLTPTKLPHRHMSQSSLPHKEGPWSGRH